MILWVKPLAISLRLMTINWILNRCRIGDFDEQTLSRIIPSKNTTVLIYCNNNFRNEPEAFPTKAIKASLNVHSFNALVSYGYKNVYELAPLLDIHSHVYRVYQMTIACTIGRSCCDKSIIAVVAFDKISIQQF